MSQWHKSAESNPPISGLYHTSNGPGVSINWYNAFDMRWYTDYIADTRCPTPVYWMPYPEPPNLVMVEQPKPESGGVAVGALVMADIKARIEIGLERYGTALQTHNGRDAMVDAYQECIDLVMYLRQAIEERDVP